MSLSPELRASAEPASLRQTVHTEQGYKHWPDLKHSTYFSSGLSATSRRTRGNAVRERSPTGTSAPEWLAPIVVRRARKRTPWSMAQRRCLAFSSAAGSFNFRTRGIHATVTHSASRLVTLTTRTRKGYSLCDVDQNQDQNHISLSQHGTEKRNRPPRKNVNTPDQKRRRKHHQTLPTYLLTMKYGLRRCTASQA